MGVKKGDLNEIEKYVIDHEHDFGDIKNAESYKLRYKELKRMILEKKRLIDEAEQSQLKWLRDIAEYVKGLGDMGVSLLNGGEKKEEKKPEDGASTAQVNAGAPEVKPEDTIPGAGKEPGNRSNIV